MSNEGIARNWQQKIISICEEKAQRTLTEEEIRFVTSRRGFLALEIIEDTVEQMQPDEMIKYLNSEKEGDVNLNHTHKQ